ncbi:MAG TPA: hypothetical protein VKB19_16005 [Pedobacter sp.]|nr:hypothetical protein [Pedobacter sp.]
MRNPFFIAQLLLRFSRGISFLLPVLDRTGYFGVAGSPNVIWGDWTSFVGYTHLLMPYLTLDVAGYFGLAATLLEILLAVMLISGYKTRYAALGSFALTLIFAGSMMFFLHFRAPFNFSVFTVSFSSLLLASFSKFPWSVDACLNGPAKLN